MPVVIISTIACFTALFIIKWMHTQHHLEIVTKPYPPIQEDPPYISVIVPARNEERNIEQCLSALLKQTYSNYEVIVVDDRSTDGTGNILRRCADQNEKLKIIPGTELPPGWAGKPHALIQGVEKAQGEWLCFIDADTFVSPDALSAVYAGAMETQADMYTIMTRQIMLTFWERTVLPLVMMALSVGFSPRKVNDPTRKDAIANGQFIFIKRDVYASTGGHTAIKNSIVEDKDLALLVKGQGYRLIIADGRQVASTRMYTNLPEMWEGWTKNIYLGLRGDPALAALGIFGAFLAIIAALGLPLWLGLSIGWLMVVGSESGALLVTIEAMLVWGYLLYWRILASRQMGIPGWYALTTPIGAGLFAAMMSVSTWNVISGKGVKWKGRNYTNK